MRFGVALSEILTGIGNSGFRLGGERAGIITRRKWVRVVYSYAYC
jgi:hypothetical protein